MLLNKPAEHFQIYHLNKVGPLKLVLPHDIN